MNGTGPDRTDRECIWCGASAITEEDVIARWIARLFTDRFWELAPNFAIQGAGWWHDMDDASEPPAKRVRIPRPGLRIVQQRVDVRAREQGPAASREVDVRRAGYGG